MLEILGILMVVQGVGGGITALLDGGPSWFLVHHLSFLDGWELPASVVLAVVGALLAARGERARRPRQARS